jgi:uncharacterized protein (TIGR03437 family)
VMLDATIQYTGEAPGLVSGVLQVNAIVLAGLPAGTAILVLSVGANSSPATVTAAVQ